MTKILTAFFLFPMIFRRFISGILLCSLIKTAEQLISAWLSTTQSDGLSLNLCPTRFLTFILVILSFLMVEFAGANKKAPSITHLLYLGRIKSALPPKFRLLSALIVSYHSHVSDNGDLRQKFLIKSNFILVTLGIFSRLKTLCTGLITYSTRRR